MLSMFGCDAKENAQQKDSDPSKNAPVQEPSKTKPVQSKDQRWAFAYDYDVTLKSIASLVIEAQEKLSNPSCTEEEKKHYNTLLPLYIKSYADKKAEYDAELKKATDKGWVKPNDVPDVAPTLDQMINRFKK